MDTDPQQDRLRALFSELRRTDEQRAPRFQDDWEAAMARRAEPTTIPWGRLAAAVVLLAVGMMVAMSMRWRLHHDAVAVQPRVHLTIGTQQPKPVEWAVADSITEWQSPTAFLLAAPTDIAWAGDVSDEAVDEPSAHSDSQHL